MKQYPFRQWAMGPCFYCNRPTYRMGPQVLHPQKYTRDHLVPRRLRYGVPPNLHYQDWTVGCCQRCNSEKGSKHPFEFLHQYPKWKREKINRAFGIVKKELAETPQKLARKLQYKMLHFLEA